MLHEIVFHSNGGYDWHTVYNMPIWLRNFTFKKMEEHFDKQNKDIYEQAADEIASNREIAGLHYRSDSLAGYELGRKIANKFIDNNFTPLKI